MGEGFEDSAVMTSAALSAWTTAMEAKRRTDVNFNNFIFGLSQFFEGIFRNIVSLLVIY